MCLWENIFCLLSSSILWELIYSFFFLSYDFGYIDFIFIKIIDFLRFLLSSNYASRLRFSSNDFSNYIFLIYSSFILSDFSCYFDDLMSFLSLSLSSYVSSDIKISLYFSALHLLSFNSDSCFSNSRILSKIYIFCFSTFLSNYISSGSTGFSDFIGLNLS